MTRPGFKKLWVGREAEGRLKGIVTLFAGPDATYADLLAAVPRYRNVFINPEFIDDNGSTTLVDVLKVVAEVGGMLTVCVRPDQLAGIQMLPDITALEVMLTVTVPGTVHQVRVIEKDAGLRGIRVAPVLEPVEAAYYLEDKNL